MANQIRFNVGFNVDKAGLNELQSALVQVQVVANKAAKTGNLKDELKEASKAASQLSDILNQSWNSKLGQLDLSKVNNGIKQAYGSVKDLKTTMVNSGPEGAAAYNQVASAILNTNLQLKQSNKLLDEMAVSMANTVKWGITSSIFNSVSGSIQKAYGYTKNLDSSLNDIRIVTEKSAESMEKFAIQANDAAKGLGASTLDYTQASLIYYQQGLSDEEVAARAETTLKAANVTGQSGEEVSEQLTAVWNGYKVTAQEAELYVDKLAAVAATTASDLEELSVGMSKVASAASIMGVDVDQLNATLATVVSVTRQAPESVGTAFKTIYARMGDIEAGLDTETTLGAYTEKMKEIADIDVLTINGELRDMGEVIEEVGNNWTNLSREQQIALSQVMAGTRQYNNLLALFDNWDMYTEALKTSGEAAGTLQKQQDIYMESTEAHLQQLSTEAERTYDILFNQETVNEFSDALTGTLGIFNDFIESIGGGGKAFLYFGSIVANVFNQQIAKAMQTQMRNFEAYKNNIAGKDLKAQIADTFSGEAYTPKEEEVTHAVQLSHASRGEIVSSKAVAEEAKIAKEILKVEKALTVEQHEQLINIQQQIGLNAQKIEDIQSYKKVFNEILNDENVSFEVAQLNLEEIGDELNEQRQSLRDINNLYRTRFDEDFVDTSDSALEHRLFLEQEIARLKDSILITEQQSQQLNQLTRNDANELELSANNIKTILNVQNQQIAEQHSRYRLLNAAIDNMSLDEQGRTQELREQNAELTRQINQETQLAQKQLKTGKGVQVATAAVGALTAISGSLGTVIDDTSSKMEKTNAWGSMISGAAIAIGSAFGPMGMAIGGTISAITTAVTSAISKSQQELEEKIKENKKQWEELRSDVESSNSNINTLESLQSEFERLSLGVTQYGENVSLTADEYEKYQDIIEQIVGISPDVVQGYTAEGKAIVNNNGLIEETIKLLQQQQIEQKKLLLTDEAMNIVYEGGQTELEEAEKEVKKAKVSNYEVDTEEATRFSSLMQNVGYFPIKENFTEEDAENYEKFNEEFNEKIVKNWTNEYGYWDIENILKNYEDFYNSLEEIRKKYKISEEDMYDNNFNFFNDLEDIVYYEKELSDEYDKAIQNREQKQKALNGKVLTWLEVYNEDYQLLTTEQQLIIQKYIDNFKADKIDKDTFNTLIEQAEDFSNNIKNLDKETQQDINEIFNLKDTGNYQEYINAVVKFFKDQAKKGEDGLSQEEIINLFGLSSLTDDSVGDEITKKGNELQKKLQETFGEDFNIYKYFSGEDILNADLRNLEIDGISLKSFESFEEFEKYYNSVIRLNQSVKELGNTLSQSQNNITAITNGLAEFQKEGQMSEETILDLERRYPELAEIQQKGSHEYLQTLRNIREQEEDNIRASLEEQRKALEEKAEYYSKLDYSDMSDVRVQADLKEFEDTMQKLLDTEYALQVQIEADLKTDVEDAFGLADELSKLQDLVPEDLTISFEEAQELIKQGYAGILENATETAEQSIKLDKATMNAFIDNRQAELESDKQAKIGQLENQRALLVTQRDALEKKLKALKEASKAENATDAATALQKAKNADKEYQIATKTLNEELKSEAKAATEEEKINEQLFNDLGGMYETNSENQQQAEKDTTDYQKEEVATRLGNIQKLYEGYKAVASARLYSEGKLIAPIPFPNEEGLEGGAEVQTTGSTDISGSEVKAEEITSEDISKYAEELFNKDKGEFDATIDALIDATEAQIDTLDQQIGSIDAGIAALLSAGKSLDTAQKSSGSQRKEEPKKEKDEIDRYWELNKAIEAVTEELSDLDKKQEKLYGKELIASLKAENELLEEQAERYRALAAEQQREASELQGLLSAYGVVFDTQGGVANYLAATQAALARYNQAVAAYNAFLIDEATFQAEQRAYENFKSLLDRYEALYYEEMRETQNKLDEIHRQELENNLKAWEVEIQLKLDMSEIERQWDDFFKDINENFKLVYEDLDATMQNLADKMKTYQGGDGDIATTLKAIKDVQAEIDKMMGGGESDMFESVSQAQEKLKELNEQLQDSALAMKELWEEAWETYLEGIDQAADQLDDLMERYENINEQIEYQRELIELLYGEEAYDLMNKYYEAQQKNTMSEIDSLKQQAELWKQQYEEALAIDEANGTISEDTQKFYELWQEAQDELNGKVIDYIELLQNDYKNTISSIINDLELSLTGGTILDDVKTQWERLQEQSDKYFDNVERIYEISNLANKYQDAIANTSNLANQQKLQELYDKEMEYLENKKNLTEYDIQAADARYQLALRQIALEEAQQNKTAMKLTRGADGNWTYQYVADEDDIASKQQELLQASQEYYQITKDGYEQNLSDMLDAQETYLQMVQEINEKYMNDEAERSARLEELYQIYYGENGILTNLYIENEERRTNLADATVTSLMTYYQIDEENFERMTSAEQELILALKDGTIESYDEILEKGTSVCQENLEAWTSAAQDIINQWNKDKGESVRAQIEKAYEAMKKANEEYQKSVDELEKAVEQDFGEDGITGALNDAQEETEELDDKTEELCDNAESNLDRYRDAVNSIGDAWNAVKDQIQDAIDLIREYLQLVGSAGSGGSSGSGTGGGAGGGNPGGGSGDGTGDSGGGDGKTRLIGASAVSPTANGYWYEELQWKKGDSIWKQTLRTPKSFTNYKGNTIEEIRAAFKLEQEKNKNLNYPSFDTGGYTGNWNGGNGRLAVLHSKELVLNAKDTENMLAAVNTVRSIANLGDSINQSIMNGISQMILGLTGLGKYGNYSIGETKESGDTIFEIQANFPNANDVESIREAIMSLPNLASQYIARNKK